MFQLSGSDKVSCAVLDCVVRGDETSFFGIAVLVILL